MEKRWGDEESQRPLIKKFKTRPGITEHQDREKTFRRDHWSVDKIFQQKGEE